MLNELGNKVVLVDSELQRRSQCALYMPTTVDPLQGPSDRTFRWAINERSRGKIRSPEELRQRFTEEWVKDWAGPEKDEAYWKGPHATGPFGRHMYTFLLKYEVIQPFQPYTLQLEQGQVSGENALVIWKKHRSAPIPMVIDAVLRRPRHTLIPDYKVLAQWLAARQEVETVNLGIAHIPMVSGEFWTTKDVNERLARQWINTIVDQVATQQDFPRAGTQCATCSRPCTVVFKGPLGPDRD
ncbi:MAG: hypothetical protein ABI197_00755 [Granulicella sp.]